MLQLLADLSRMHAQPRRSLGSAGFAADQSPLVESYQDIADTGVRDPDGPADFSMAQGMPLAVVAPFEQEVEDKGSVQRDRVEPVRRVHLAPAFPRQSQQGHQSAFRPAAADVGLEDVEYPAAEGLGLLCARKHCD